MKTVKKNVYYCEHCKKRSLSASHMNKHEIGCTANLNRECRMCGRKSISELIEEYKIRFTLAENMNKTGDDLGQLTSLDTHCVIWTDKPVTMDEIIKSVDDCPNCVLAILRQVGFNRHYFHFEPYNYKERLSEAFIGLINEKNNEYEYYN